MQDGPGMGNFNIHMALKGSRDLLVGLQWTSGTDELQSRVKSTIGTVPPGGCSIILTRSWFDDILAETDSSWASSNLIFNISLALVTENSSMLLFNYTAIDQPYHTTSSTLPRLVAIVVPIIASLVVAVLVLAFWRIRVNRRQRVSQDNGSQTDIRPFAAGNSNGADGHEDKLAQSLQLRSSKLIDPFTLNQTNAIESQGHKYTQPPGRDLPQSQHDSASSTSSPPSSSELAEITDHENLARAARRAGIPAQALLRALYQMVPDDDRSESSVTAPPGYART
ncbi:hypothetical protein BKA62DRAFT_512686 [Auriculariales sp. MPI-PUGE-AT-0066]|nr:hypothetical protein BKA62DRAFT_512686 [Auriculariales sp. MPI-PUGE-AT-0066]